MKFRKSTRSQGNSNCLEVAQTENGVAIRDSKEVRRVGEENATVLHFTPSEWKAFVAGVKDGEFDF